METERKQSKALEAHSCVYLKVHNDKYNVGLFALSYFESQSVLSYILGLWVVKFTPKYLKGLRTIRRIL